MKSVALVFFGLFVFVQCDTSHMPTFQEFCAHVITTGGATCDQRQCKGRPGKSGPVGPAGNPGLKGQKGEQGTSEGLEDRVKDLEGSLRELKTMILQNDEIKGGFCYMGMKSGKIPESSITASSEWNSDHGPKRARLDTQPVGSVIGSWAAKSNRVGEWIQVDLGQTKLVAGLVTQGRAKYNQWVTSYKVSCGSTIGNLATITEHGAEKIFSANRNSETKVVNKFPKPVFCRYIRIYPQTWHNHISMRFEPIRGSCHDMY